MEQEPYSHYHNTVPCTALGSPAPLGYQDATLPVALFFVQMYRVPTTKLSLCLQFYSFALPSCRGTITRRHRVAYLCSKSDLV